MIHRMDATVRTKTTQMSQSTILLESAQNNFETTRLKGAFEVFPKELESPITNL